MGTGYYHLLMTDEELRLREGSKLSQMMEPGREELDMNPDSPAAALL